MGKVWGGMGVGFTSVAIVVQIRAIREALRVRRGVAFLRGDGAKRCSLGRHEGGKKDHKRAERGTKEHEGGKGKAARGGAKGQESQPPAVARTKHQEESLLFL